MKPSVRLKSDLVRKISFSGGFLVCVRIPLFCRTVGGRREVRCDFSRVHEPRHREDNMVLFSRN
jgi:hypothetical protein